MVGSSQSSQTEKKKQAALTSFFTARTTNGPSQKPPPTAAEGRAPGRKRPLEEDISSSRANESLNKTTKRSKHDHDDTEIPERSSSPAGEKTKPTKSTPKLSPEGPTCSGRTERYAYDGPGSSAAAGSAASQGTGENEDEEERRRKEAVHRKFVKKLGHPDSMTRIRRNHAGAPNGEDGEGADEGEAVEEEEAPAPVKGKKGSGAKTGKLTPMEVQFLDIKRKHMDTVLIVEVGYKFKFFGEDARIAAKELSIVCMPGKLRYDEDASEKHLDRFASASIPVHRLPVHAKRLVAAGHKVGVVRQIETAALKKAGDNRGGVFIRKLTNVYTKGTYVDEIGELDQAGDKDGSPTGGYLLCITESKAKGSGTDEKVDVGMIAVQPATGDIIYDYFEDGFMRREIETRLLHISPCEFLMVGDMTKATDKLIQHLSGSSANVFGDRSRVERVPKSPTMAYEAHSHVTQFYAGKTADDNDNDHAAALLAKVLKLPEAVMICLSAMIRHLTEYGLEHIFDLTKYFQSFSTKQHMLINGTTLESLEVYRNSTDHSAKGSLLWALDKTQTRFGRRLLRKWIGRPLLDRRQLEERVFAVQELLDKQNTVQVEKLSFVLNSIKLDLERSLIRIYYGKCTRSELLSTLRTLQKISTHYTKAKTETAEDTGFECRLLYTSILALPSMGDMAVKYLNKINPEAAQQNDKYAFFREDEETDDITERKLGIAAVEQELDAHRHVAAAKLSKKAPVTYVTVAGIEYLIEVTNSDLKRVPASWAKISGTKKVSRFHTPEVMAMVSERDQHKEALAAACDAAFAELLRAIAVDYQALRDAVESLATLDCLLSFSKVAALPGYSRPVFLADDTPPTVSITGGRHPMAEHMLPNGYIPFTTSLRSPAPLAQLITGPNMGGKSSYVRAVALLVLLAQIGSFVPVDAMQLTLADAIHTRMGARDNLFAGESTFMVEVSETAAILAAATPRSLVVLDELGRGTSTHDGAAIAHAVLEHVVRESRCLTLFITHYQNLARLADGLGPGLVRCVHMRFTADASADPDKEEITFLYDVADGVAHRSYGLNVARLARIPQGVLDVAARKSRMLEDDIKARRLRTAAALLADLVHGHGAAPHSLDHLISAIEQL